MNLSGSGCHTTSSAVAALMLPQTRAEPSAYESITLLPHTKAWPQLLGSSQTRSVLPQTKARPQPNVVFFPHTSALSNTSCL